jgi:hypothetical protein
VDLVMLERSRTNTLVVYESHESGGNTRFWKGSLRIRRGPREYLTDVQ